MACDRHASSYKPHGRAHDSRCGLLHERGPEVSACAIRINRKGAFLREKVVYVSCLPTDGTEVLSGIVNHPYLSLQNAKAFEFFEFKLPCKQVRIFYMENEKPW